MLAACCFYISAALSGGGTAFVNTLTNGALDEPLMQGRLLHRELLQAGVGLGRPEIHACLAYSLMCMAASQLQDWHAVRTGLNWQAASLMNNRGAAQIERANGASHAAATALLAPGLQAKLMLL